VIGSLPVNLAAEVCARGGFAAHRTERVLFNPLSPFFRLPRYLSTEPIHLEAVMNKHGKLSSILAAVMVMILAAPGVAGAGGRYDNGGHYHGYPQQGKSGGHYNNHNKYTYNNYYNTYYQGGYHKGGGYYYKGGGYYYPYTYGYNNYCYGNQHHHNNHNNNNEDLWIGLLGGGIVGYTLSNIYPVR
jgi:hypothetical protein